MARQGKEDSLQLGQALHHVSWPSPGVQDEASWEGAVLLQQLLQLPESTHTVYLRTSMPLYGVH